MHFPRTMRRGAALTLTFTLLVSHVAAQRPAPAAAQRPAPASAPAAPSPESAPAPTIDTLLAADSYAVYGEMRAVGQYVSSQEFKDMLEPLRSSGALPADLNDLLDFIIAHAEQLSTARVAFAAVPSAEGLPSAVTAIELPSVADAQKFEPQLRAFASAHFAAPDEPGGERASQVSATLGGAPSAARRANGRRTRVEQVPPGTRLARANAVKEEAPAPFYLKRSGSLVVLADRQFTFGVLRGAAGSMLLADEPGFRTARARLAADTLFVYFNTTRMSRAFKRQVEEVERERKRFEEQAQRKRERSGAQARPSDNASVTANGTATSVSMNSSGNANAQPPGVAAESQAAPEEIATLKIEGSREDAKKLTPEEEKQEVARAQQREFENQLSQLIFTGGVTGGAWPESIGVGAALEGDAAVLRAFLVTGADERALRPVPFIPIMLAGPQLSPEAAGLVPANTDIFVTASLDLPQMYDYVSSAFRLFDLAAQATGEQDKQGLFESQVSGFERANKFRIREDLINSLGNEIAVCLPGDFFGVRRARKIQKVEAEDSTGQESAPASPSGPVFVVSLADKKALQELLPRVLEAVGLKGVSEQQLLQKQGDVELLTFAQGSVAFIDHFLVLAPDAASMRWVVEAYNRRETLANSDEFRAAAWQPRPLLGQIYLSNALLKEMFGEVFHSAEDIRDERVRALIARTDPNPGAITHALTRDADGLLHELHIPKNLLSLISAGELASKELAPMRANESRAMFALYNIARMQDEHKKSNGRYATRAELENAARKKLKSQDSEGTDEFFAASSLELEGYEIRIAVSGDKFEATATPTLYRGTGRRSFFIDETKVLRGADLGGRPASASTDPVNY